MILFVKVSLWLESSPSLGRYLVKCKFGDVTSIISCSTKITVEWVSLPKLEEIILLASLLTSLLDESLIDSFSGIV